MLTRRKSQLAFLKVTLNLDGYFDVVVFCNLVFIMKIAEMKINNQSI